MAKAFDPDDTVDYVPAPKGMNKERARLMLEHGIKISMGEHLKAGHGTMLLVNNTNVLAAGLELDFRTTSLNGQPRQITSDGAYMHTSTNVAFKLADIERIAEMSCETAQQRKRKGDIELT